MSSKALVLVLGISGRTGKSITDGLLASGSFRVAALVRPSSVSKPAVQSFREKGVEIREGDLQDSPEKLKEYLSGVDILISAVYYEYILDQKPLFQAAKEVGVKRVVPCDFGTPGEKGVRKLHDEKYEVQEFIKKIGVPYTFIDVGWWMQLTLPHPARSTSVIKPLTLQLHGNSDKKNLFTNLDRIGTFVARIVADERTINKYVIIWEAELTQREAKSVAAKYSGEEEALKAAMIHVSKEELLQSIPTAREAYDKDPSAVNRMALTGVEYQYSMHILGENNLETAKRLGALDARELYPDIPVASFEEFAKSYYATESWKNI